ncbi:MAG: alpha/beta fold hydrolase [Nocardioidaceae bacterium]|nr:alpha/beta fold hydrolase [Nocardioidaceae bacterium]NUS50935.1 alpha/beta fold hydrolase [Nocardioidaceae bacterium]
MTQRYLDVGDTTLFVDDRGPAHAPALLYAHGGPGMSCWDFMHEQGDRLAADLRVVGVDQRGLLRSGPVGTRPLTAARIVADFEAVRTALGIDAWAVLGHSGGGAYALDYALAHPDAVAAAVFDCPCWDADSTDRHRLPVTADLLERYGHLDEAARCRELATTPRRLTAEDRCHEPMQALDDHYQEMFFADAGVAAAFDAARKESGLGEESWDRGRHHLPLMADMYVDRRPLLARLTVPSLVVHGRGDLVVTPDMLDRYAADVPEGKVHVFERSAHFPCHEEPDEYAAVLSSFLREHAR